MVFPWIFVLLCTSCAATSLFSSNTSNLNFLYAEEWFTPKGTIPSATPTPSTPTALPTPTPPLGFQPNFVFILADDQDRILGKDGYDSLGSLSIMPNLRQEMLAKGAVVENFMVNTPICCPSRTEFFTGRYFHNVGPPTHMNGTCMHADTTIAGANMTGMWGLMKQAGYNVGIFGKTTNDQARMLQQLGDARSASYIDSPVDYNDYMGLRYWRYNDTSDTHRIETLSTKDPVFDTAYQTTQIGNRTMRWLQTAVDESLTKAGRPFFAYIGPHAPHFPAQPAPWYEHAFDGLTAPVTPNYNVSSPGKAQHVRQNPPLDKEAKCWEDQHFRDRWSSLLSVDDILGEVVQYLTHRDVMEQTYVIYSSDHGYKLGQWRLGTSKQHPYETDIRVPFIIRGPGIIPGRNFTQQIAGNVDVMPTMLHLAAGKDFVQALNVDGRAMTFLLEEKGDTRDYWLNEYLSVSTYWNDHSAIWEDGQTTTMQCGGDPKRGPRNPSPFQETCNETEGVGDGKCWYVDSLRSNSWRQLRIMNSTMNWNYVEYDPDWKFDVTDRAGAGLQHYEWYDVASDPYQMNNMYSTLDRAMKIKLHQQLSDYYQCSGRSCP